MGLNISPVTDDTLGQITTEESGMIPLNDDWLSWPPDSLEHFMDEQQSYQVSQATELENNNVSPQDDINH